jgi:exopolysaccharide biosynthesis protein
MSNQDRRGSFGERRSSRSEIKRGSRPLSNQEVSRKSNNSSLKDASTSSNKPTRSSIRSQTSTEKVEDASFSTNINEVKKPRQARSSAASARSTSKNKTGRYTVGTKKNKPRDNSSRFDD